jgi:hypothetical protein
MIMRKIFTTLFMATLAFSASAQAFKDVPRDWKWLDSKEVIFTYDGTFADSSAFVVEAKTGKVRTGVSAPAAQRSYVCPTGWCFVLWENKKLTALPDKISKKHLTNCVFVHIINKHFGESNSDD